MRRNIGLILLAIVLLALVLLAYSNHFHNAFQFDDDHSIVTNGAIRDLRNIPRFFVDATTTSSAPANQTYRPGVTALHAIDYALGGRLDPFFFHRSIFISYLILGVLLYLFFAKIAEISCDWPWRKALALLAAGWFMVHTANAETINYISQRADSFSTLMVVLAFVVYQYKPGWRRYYLYLVPMIIGILVKPPAMMFAPLLFFYDLLFERNSASANGAQVSGRAQLSKSFTVALPAMLVALVLGALAATLTPAYTIPSSIPRLSYLITQPFAVVHYFDNFVLPLQLSADTDWRPLATPIDDRFFVGMALILLLVGMALWTARRQERRPVAFGIVWFLVALLPTSSFFQLDEVLNDHRTFFPYIGLVLAFSWIGGLTINKYRSFFARSAVARIGVVVVVATLLLGHAYGAYQRNRVWSTPETLWYDATLKSPANPRALMNYGLTQMRKGNLDVALDYFKRALVLAPSYSYLHINLGVLHGAMNRPAEAESYFKNGMLYAPNSPEAYYFYAVWLNDQGRVEEARSMAEKAVALSPGHIEAQELVARLNAAGLYTTHINDSLTYYRAGDYRKSLEAAQKAAQVKPDSDIAYNNVCAAYNQLKLWDEAIEACQHALTINPNSELARNNLAVAQRAKQ